jgi:hypothetical protein
VRDSTVLSDVRLALLKDEDVVTAGSLRLNERRLSVNGDRAHDPFVELERAFGVSNRERHVRQPIRADHDAKLQAIAPPCK